MDKNHQKNSKQVPISSTADAFFSINEVSQYLKIPKSTIYKLSEQNKIPSLKIGKQLRFRKSSVDKWAAEMEAGPGVHVAQQTINQPSPKRIMVIDDDKLVLKTVAKLLKSHGYSVEPAESGEEALSRIGAEKFDLIITDVRMPGMSGIETLKRIRQLLSERSLAPVPEIVITGYIDTAAESEAEGLGINDYLYKPFAIPEFIRAVRDKINLN
jgi:excisionase family DNA binding protein